MKAVDFVARQHIDEGLDVGRRKVITAYIQHDAPVTKGRLILDVYTREIDLCTGLNGEKLHQGLNAIKQAHGLPGFYQDLARADLQVVTFRMFDALVQLQHNHVFCLLAARREGITRVAVQPLVEIIRGQRDLFVVEVKTNAGLCTEHKLPRCGRDFLGKGNNRKGRGLGSSKNTQKQGQTNNKLFHAI